MHRNTLGHCVSAHFSLTSVLQCPVVMCDLRQLPGSLKMCSVYIALLGQGQEVGEEYNTLIKERKVWKLYLTVVYD